ncbi:MmpS family transport accessory protein [Actinomadura rupiterrae]|uniref:MmpS family transport accessory protein n=1 Tax=Actinomadura rupiterrae TaxID=559627 RepID=UPI0020A5D545|nr:MmpS family transport accessory protein [Actinomadura rupiterrae]MCP2339147.1 hypothetical protein [Actinomadura rupiterrae]
MQHPARLATALAAAVALAACQSPDRAADPTIAPPTQGSGPAKVQHSVVYEVTGTVKTADLIYATPSGTEKLPGAKLPWRKQLAGGAGQFLMVNVSSYSTSGSVACTITVDGKVVKQAASSKEAVVAFCDYATPS